MLNLTSFFCYDKSRKGAIYYTFPLSGEEEEEEEEEEEG